MKRSVDFDVCTYIYIKILCIYIYVHICIYLSGKYLHMLKFDYNKVNIQWRYFARNSYIAIYNSFLEFEPYNRFTPMDTLSQWKQCYISLGTLHLLTGISREQTNVAQDNSIHVMWSTPSCCFNSDEVHIYGMCQWKTFTNDVSSKHDYYDDNTVAENEIVFVEHTRFSDLT